MAFASKKRTKIYDIDKHHRQYFILKGSSCRLLGRSMRFTANSLIKEESKQLESAICLDEKVVEKRLCCQVPLLFSLQSASSTDVGMVSRGQGLSKLHGN